MELEKGKRAGDRADERPRTTNATINYRLNGCNRFLGAEGSKDGRKGSVLVPRPDLRSEIQRPSWLSRGIL